MCKGAEVEAPLTYSRRSKEASVADLEGVSGCGDVAM